MGKGRGGYGGFGGGMPNMKQIQQMQKQALKMQKEMEEATAELEDATYTAVLLRLLCPERKRSRRSRLKKKQWIRMMWKCWKI